MGMIGNIKNRNGTVLFKMYESHADARRQAFRVHYHTEIELSLILCGFGTYNSDGKLYPIKTGDVFFYKSSHHHCMTDIAEGGMRILNIHISPLYMHLVKSQAAQEHFGREFLSGSFDTVRLTDTLTKEAGEKLRTLILSIKEELEEKRHGYELLAESYLAEIFVLLSRCALKTQKQSGGEGSEVIFRTLEFIDEHYTEQISLLDLSLFARLEKTYFATLFKRVIGTNPWEYVLIKRIEKAVELLKNTDQSVLSVAGKVGFNNTANFNKIFKKYTGTSPKELRKPREKIQK